MPVERFGVVQIDDFAHGGELCRQLAGLTFSGEQRGRRPGPEHVVGVVVGAAASAWPYTRAASGEVIHATVGESAIMLWRDDGSGGIRAAAINAEGIQRELPTIMAYRQAWLKFHPGSVIESR